MLADFYAQLTKALPDAQFEDTSDLLDEVRMVKSEEELGWVRQSARLSDMAYQVFQGLVEEGQAESDVFGEVEHMVKRFGAENTYFMMAADPQPVPKFIDLAFEQYQRGDLVLFNAEIAGPAGYWTQLVRTLSLGKVANEAVGAYSACTAALEAAESLLMPGKSTIDLYDTIRSTIEQEGYRMGLHPGHSQGLDIFERPLINGRDDVELRAGMIIVLHPHALMPSGGGVWIGETYVVTTKGHHRLHRSSRHLCVL
jgi:Xaa-Pro aminopeptidase